MKSWIWRAVLLLGVAFALLATAALWSKPRAEDVEVRLMLTCLPANPAAEIFARYGLVLVKSYSDGYGQSRERWEAPDGSDWAEVGLVSPQGGKGMWRCIVAAATPPGEPS